MIDNVTPQSPLRQPHYLPFPGLVTNISDFSMSNWNRGCNKIMHVQGEGTQVVNFVITKDTYFVFGEKIDVGEIIIGFYNANAPAALIYPPQFHAAVVAKPMPGESIKVDFFDRNLISADGNLQIRPGGSTEIILTNGQDFTGEIFNRVLIVVYRATTKSIPAQTTPDLIVVMC